MSNSESVQRVLLDLLHERVSRFGFGRASSERLVKTWQDGTKMVLLASARLRPYGLHVSSGVGIRFDKVEAIKHEVSTGLSKKLKAQTLTLGCGLDRLSGEKRFMQVGATVRDLPLISELIAEDFQSFGLPYLEQYSDMKAALDGLLEDDAKAANLNSSLQNRIMSALTLSFLIGDRIRYDQILRERTHQVEVHPNTVLRVYRALVDNLEGKWKANELAADVPPADRGRFKDVNR